MNWGLEDVTIFTAMLFTVGVALALTKKFTRKKRTQIVISLTVLAAFFLVWLELAAGIFH